MTTYISDAQAGGKEKRSTTDHLLILKEIAREQRRRKKPLYIVFLDVTKAFDKAWLDGIMYAMHQNGLTGPLWNIVRKMNQNLTATIKTKDGPTRPIKIKDSIRQGGVLSGLQYATLMDEIAKEIAKQNKGCNIPGHQEKLGCLLWMDDVALITDKKDEIQDLLNITHKISSKYHIQFGEEKTKCMVIGSKHKPTLKLGAMVIETTNKYKYLGEIIHEKMNLESNITEARGKAEGALQTLLAIAGDPTLRGIQMDTIWKLVETCIIPVITYGSETWEPTKKETKSLNQILDNILKRILKVPTSTPRESLYIETGLIDIEHTRIQKRIAMLHRLDKTKSNLLDKILQNPNDQAWKPKTEQLMKDIQYRMPEHEESQTTTKEKIKQAIKKTFRTNIIKDGEGKSKIQHLLNGKEHWIIGERPTYMTKMSRDETSLIFKARSRMLPVKNNYKSKYRDLKCRGCKAETETQQHALQDCNEIHKNEEKKVKPSDYFSDDIHVLQKTATNIQFILHRIEQSDIPSTAQLSPTVQPGIRDNTH